MIFTLFIIFKAGPGVFIKSTLRDPLIMYSLCFSLVFALFIGASTLNFGTLVRYKIPCMPFYIISLFLIYEKVKERAKNKPATQFIAIPAAVNDLSPAIS
jgi:hypothetical protein